MLVVCGISTGTIYERLFAPIPPQADCPTVLELIMVQSDRLLTLTKAQHLALPECVSVAISGNVDPETGVLSTAIGFPLWKLEPVRSQIQLRFNLPVALEQKANAGALAEYYFGAGQKAGNLVFIALAPAVRAGILTDGKLYTNSGGTAGQIGNLRLAAEGPAGLARPGTLSGFASAAGMLELARMRFPQHWEADADLFQIIRDAQNGDPFALEVFPKRARRGRSGGSDAPAAAGSGCYRFSGAPEEAFIQPARVAIRRDGSSRVCAPRIVPSGLCARLLELKQSRLLSTNSARNPNRIISPEALVMRAESFSANC